MSIIAKLYHAYPNIAAVIGSQTAARSNYMAAAWHSYISHSPALYAVSISPKRCSHDMILQNREFNCNFLAFEHIQMIQSVGRISGFDCEKTRLLQLGTQPGQEIAVPYLKAAYAVYECKLNRVLELGDHSLFVGEIVNIIQSLNCSTADGVLNVEKIKPALYLGQDTYLTTAPETVQRLSRDIDISK
jgi:flavin reductase (DIM6/NTAB) family NADH-FMN oxidoreductase RutF